MPVPRAVLAAAVLAAFGGPAFGWFYALTAGSALGATQAIHTTGHAQYFGRNYLGAIRGVPYAFEIGGAAFGPLPFAAGLAWTGSHAAVLTGCCACAWHAEPPLASCNDPHLSTPARPGCPFRGAFQCRGGVTLRCRSRCGLACLHLGSDALWGGVAMLAGLRCAGRWTWPALRKLLGTDALPVTALPLAGAPAAAPWATQVDARMRKRAAPLDLRGAASVWSASGWASRPAGTATSRWRPAGTRRGAPCAADLRSSAPRVPAPP